MLEIAITNDWNVSFDVFLLECLKIATSIFYTSFTYFILCIYRTCDVYRGSSH